MAWSGTSSQPCLPGAAGSLLLSWRASQGGQRRGAGSQPHTLAWKGNRRNRFSGGNSGSGDGQRAFSDSLHQPAARCWLAKPTRQGPKAGLRHLPSRPLSLRAAGSVTRAKSPERLLGRNPTQPSAQPRPGWLKGARSRRDVLKPPDGAFLARPAPPQAAAAQHPPGGGTPCLHTQAVPPESEPGLHGGWGPGKLQGRDAEVGKGRG